jgi:hypothetical protein
MNIASLTDIPAIYLALIAFWMLCSLLNAFFAFRMIHRSGELDLATLLAAILAIAMGPCSILIFLLCIGMQALSQIVLWRSKTNHEWYALCKEIDQSLERKSERTHE